jgi:hypothetical protein
MMSIDRTLKNVLVKLGANIKRSLYSNTHSVRVFELSPESYDHILKHNINVHLRKKDRAGPLGE